MLPITKTIPKEMLPVGTKPVIHYLVEALSKAGIKEIIMVISTGKHALQEYFDKNFELEQALLKKWKLDMLQAINEPKDFAKITFVQQSELLWTGHAIMQAAPWIQDDFAMIVYADTIYHPKLFKDMLATHQKTQKPVMALTKIPMEDVYKYWVAKMEGDYMVDLIEKPAVEDAPSNLITFSPYIIPKRFFSLLEWTQADEKSWEIYPRPALKEIMKWEWVIWHITDLPFRDTWNPESWMKANLEVGQNPELLN